MRQVLDNLSAFVKQPTLYFGLGNVAIGLTMFNSVAASGVMLSVPLLTTIVLGTAAMVNCSLNVHSELYQNPLSPSAQRWKRMLGSMHWYMYAVGCAFAANFIASAAQMAYGLEIFKCSKTLLNMMGGEIELVKAAGICLFNGALSAGHIMLGHKMQHPPVVQPLIVNYEKPRMAPANQYQREWQATRPLVIQPSKSVVYSLEILNPNFSIKPDVAAQSPAQAPLKIKTPQAPHVRAVSSAARPLKQSGWRGTPTLNDSMFGIWRFVACTRTRPTRERQ